MKRLIPVILSLVMLLSLFAITACDNNDAPADTDAPAAGDDQTLIVVVPGLPVSLDPHASADTNTAYFSHQMYDPLFMMDPLTLEPVKNLVASYDRPDMQTMNITLRDDVFFHNGDQLTAHDVEFSLKRALEMPVSFIVSMIDDVVAHDDLTLTITTSYPFAPLKEHLAHYGASILSQRAVEEAGDLYHENPVGSGPFKFDSIILGDRVELVRFDDYWGHMPEFSRLSWRVIPEATNRLIEVEAGAAHIALVINPNDVPRAEASDDLVVHRALGIGAHYIGFNTNHEPFGDIRVRQAIAHALDLPMISQTAFEGSGQFGASMISPMVWGAVDIEPFEYNLDIARQLMEEAGFPDGFSTTLWWSPNDAQYALVVQMIQSQLREIGIEITPQSMEWGAYLAAVYSGEHDMFLLSWYTPTVDADYGMYGLTHSNNANGGNNLTNFTSPRIDELLMEGQSSPDPARRLEIYAELQQLIRDYAAYLFYHYTEEIHVVSPNIRGFVQNPTGQHDMWRVTFG